jgi:hypothetical protein
VSSAVGPVAQVEAGVDRHDAALAGDALRICVIVVGIDAAAGHLLVAAGRPAARARYHGRALPLAGETLGGAHALGLDPHS